VKRPIILLFFSIFISVVIANYIIITSDQHNRDATALWTMNVTAAIASSLGIVAVYRHGVRGLHGKSYLFLTLGLFSWFSADLALLYYYYAIGVEEQKFVSISDGLWFIGYGFLSLHLFTIDTSLHSSSNTSNVINRKFVIIGSLIITIVFAIFNGFNLMFSEFIGIAEERVDLTSIAITLAYPILDLILIILSSIVLFKLRKNYQQSVPWFLSSLSLLVNAIADDAIADNGYLVDFINGNSRHLISWDLLYVADFIIMAGALFWYNRYHITSNKRSTKTIELEL
jgi:hypothetical protein